MARRVAPMLLAPTTAEQIAEQMQRRWEHQPGLGTGQPREIRGDLAGARRLLERCRAGPSVSARHGASDALGCVKPR